MCVEERGWDGRHAPPAKKKNTRTDLSPTHTRSPLLLQVTIFTPHHDPARCFPETLTGTFTVTVAGAWFPRTICGRAAAACAVVRCALATAAAGAAALCARTPWDAAVVDQVAAAVPCLHAATAWRTPVLFYCHFPDLLLAPRQGRGAVLRALYRAPLDALEQAATGCADALLVNSHFTAGVFRDTFTRLAGRGVRPGVLYPAAAIPTDDALETAVATWEAVLPPAVVSLVKGTGGSGGGGSGGGTRGGGGAPSSSPSPSSSSSPPPTVFVSINRFERKKDIGLAVRALATLVHGGQEGGGCGRRRRAAGADEPAATTTTTRAAGPTAAPADAVLIVAGGYDPRLPENVAHLAELEALAAAEGVAGRVAFLPSFTDAQRAALLAVAAAVLYTPSGEHFGIVPVEAGAAGVPVIAVASGGPLESVVDGVTGWLVEASPAGFAAAMGRVVAVGSAGVRGSVGAAARAHARAHFSRPAFGEALQGEVERMVVAHAGRPGWWARLWRGGREEEEAQTDGGGGGAAKGRHRRRRVAV